MRRIGTYMNKYVGVYGGNVGTKASFGSENREWPQPNAGANVAFSAANAAFRIPIYEKKVVSCID